jgi:hypothetical protein
MAKRTPLLDRSTHVHVPSQMGIAFPTQGTLDPRVRAEIVALLGRLLLQAARAEREGEVDDDAS